MFFSSKKSNTGANAIELLKADHRTVETLFGKFDQARTAAQRISLAQQICTELLVHAQAEEKVFYPAAQSVLNSSEEGMVDEAIVEHRSLKQLIAAIDGSSPTDDLFDANLTVLKEYVQHHVKEEENELMPGVEATDLDLDEVGARLEKFKKQLKSKIKNGKSASTGRVRVPTVDAKTPRRGVGKSKVARSGTRLLSTSGARKSRVVTKRKATKPAKAAGGRTKA